MEPMLCACGLIAVGKCTKCGKWLCNNHSRGNSQVLCDECSMAPIKAAYEEWQAIYLPSLPTHPLARLLTLFRWGQIDNNFARQYADPLYTVSTFASWNQMARFRNIAPVTFRTPIEPRYWSHFKTNGWGNAKVTGWLFPFCQDGGGPYTGSHYDGDGSSTGTYMNGHVLVLADGRLTTLQYDRPNRSVSGPFKLHIQPLNASAHSVLLTRTLLGIMSSSYDAQRITATLH